MPRLDNNLALYRSLYTARMAENYIIKYYGEDEMKTPMHMSMGQEAIPVAVCAALGDSADVFCSYRSHATFLARTDNIEAFFAELYGRITGTAEGKAGSMHLADFDRGHLCSTAIVSSAIPVAVGTAFANKSLGTERMAVVFFGDGALDEGNFWESLNAACSLRLPMLFVCEDNGLAVHTAKAARHGYRSITAVVNGFDCIAVESDSNDVEELRELTEAAIQRSRGEQRPAFLHYKCHRYLEHVGVNEDFHEGYRSKSDHDLYLEQDCLKIQREKLLKLGIDVSELERIETAIEGRIRLSVERAKQAPFAPASSLYTGVFYEKA